MTPKLKGNSLVIPDMGEAGPTEVKYPGRFNPILRTSAWTKKDSKGRGNTRFPDLTHGYSEEEFARHVLSVGPQDSTEKFIYNWLFVMNEIYEGRLVQIETPAEE